MDQALAAIHEANAARVPFTLEFLREDNAVVIALSYPPLLRSLIEGQLYAHYPDLHLDRMPEPALDPAAATVRWTAHLHLERELFPIRRYPQFIDSPSNTAADPLTAILTAVGRSNGKTVSAAVRLTVRPAKSRRRRRAQAVLRRLARPFFRRHPFLADHYVRLALSPLLPVRLLSVALGHLAYGDPAEETAALTTSSTRLHDREEDLQAGGDKLSRLLFEIEIELSVTAPRDQGALARQKITEIAGAFGQFNSARLAAFRLGRIRRAWHFHRGGPTALLSTEELATLFHPPTLTVRAETLTAVESREFEPPVRLPTPRKHPGLPVLGIARFRDRREPFGILRDDARRHLLIEGKTGMGKTTLLHHLLTSAIRRGEGVGLIDPHGDLADAVLAQIPPSRTNQVVLFDVGDTAYPLSFNVLACRNPGQRPLVASGVLSAFKKLYGDSWGPRLEHILRNALLTLLEVPGSSLVSVLRILSDATYRRGILGRVSDPVVRAFWEHEFAGLPPKIQAEAIAPIQNKVGHFVSSPLLRNILGQARSRLDLRRVMDDGQVLLVNLSKGRIGDDASTLLGSLLVTSLQLAAMSRADVPEAERRDFALYVDEFQNFATDSFATILSEARKYRLSLTLANQYLAQMDEATLAAVFGNIGTLIAFQVGAQDSRVLAEQLGGELREQDLLQLPRYRAYVRLLIDGRPSAPFSMQTIPPASLKRDPGRPLVVRRYCRQRYAQAAARVEREIASALGRP
jgi:hypothetical protein